MSTRRASRIALWIVQVVLAALFLFAGGFKLVTPTAQLAKMVAPLSAGFIQFIGVCEVLGALGLVLPGLFRVWLRLTPLAAAGLVIIMSGAVVVTATTQSVTGAVFPLVVGLLATLVVLGRRSPTARTI